MLTILLLVLVVLFLASGYGGRRAGWYGPSGGGLEYFAYIIAVVLLVWAVLRLLGIAF